MTMTCVPEKNKRIFATRVEAEEFEKRNRATFGNQQQYAYDCPHGGHVHLSSSPSSVIGAPQIKTTDWENPRAGWRVVDPEVSATRKEMILAALRRHKGSRTAREIAIECGLPDNGRFTLVYSIARDHDLPFLMKRTYGRTTTPPAITLQNVQSQRERLEAELRRLGEQEQALRQQEEEKRRVTVKVASNGNNRTTMIFATACGNALWLTAEQADSLLAQLPGVIENMKSRQEAAGAVAGQ